MEQPEGLYVRYGSCFSCSQVVLVIEMVYFSRLRIFVLPKAVLKKALTQDAVEGRFVFCLAILL